MSIVDSRGTALLVDAINAMDFAHEHDIETRWDAKREARHKLREAFRNATGWTLVWKRGRWTFRR